MNTNSAKLTSVPYCRNCGSAAVAKNKQRGLVPLDLNRDLYALEPSWSCFVNDCHVTEGHMSVGWADVDLSKKSYEMFWWDTVKLWRVGAMTSSKQIIFRDQVESKSRYSYVVVKTELAAVLVIVDLYTDERASMTVTNGAEQVLEEIHTALTKNGIEMPQLVVYQDTECRWDRLYPKLLSSGEDVRYGVDFGPFPEAQSSEVLDLIDVAEMLVESECSQQGSID